MDGRVSRSLCAPAPPRPAITWHLGSRRWSGGQKAFTAKNPPYGAILSYYLKDAVPPEAPKKEEKDKKDTVEEKPKTDAKADAAEKKEGKAKITVLDKDGKLFRELDCPVPASVNRST